ncbi:ICT1 [Mytilus edulis]|uniref:Large ribosomal subunit protein mL62 n=1 Tax=Mytilus edulis TaxID=6550 RepID=A0A8S3UAD4_MYTED|nr:ICT1 [Mytilus edulis]
MSVNRNERVDTATRDIIPAYVVQQLTSYQRHGFKSIYSIDKIYPNSNPDILKENRLETVKPGFTGFIPVEKLEIKSSRGSGPGGQSVNKSNNKVEIRFHVASADWIPDNLKDKFLEQLFSCNKEHLLIAFPFGSDCTINMGTGTKAILMGWFSKSSLKLQGLKLYRYDGKNRINKEGYFITMSHKTRKHILNQSDCINKLRTAIYECMIEREPPSEEHLEKLNKRLAKQQRERLREKRSHSLKKQDRKTL